MRKAWICAGGGAVVGLIALGLVVFTGDGEARPSVWTNGTQVCDAPGGRSASTTQFPGFGGPGTPTNRKTLLVAYRATWQERLRWSVSMPSLLWANADEFTAPYAPAAGTDVRDDAGVLWWRCDLVK